MYSISFLLTRQQAELDRHRTRGWDREGLSAVQRQNALPARRRPLGEASPAHPSHKQKPNQGSDGAALRARHAMSSHRHTKELTLP